MYRRSSGSVFFTFSRGKNINLASGVYILDGGRGTGIFLFRYLVLDTVFKWIFYPAGFKREHR